VNVLVTGAYGFIGSALVRRLSDRHDRVVGVVRDEPALSPLDLAAGSGTAERVIAKGDILDTDFIYRLLVDYDITRVFHTAAHSAVSKCQKDPQNAWRVNTLGTVSVLEACRRYGKVEAVVTASTDKVYGDGPIPYVETQPLQAKDPYAASKIAADLAARSYAHIYALPVKVIRSCNVFGPGDLEFSRLIPGSINRMLHGESAVLYNNATHMIREFVYIDDEVDAYLTVADDGAVGEAYNVSGTGRVSVGQVMKELTRLCDGQIEYLPRDFYEIPEQYMNAAKLMLLGWTPKVNLAEGLERTVGWYRWWFSITSAGH